MLRSRLFTVVTFVGVLAFGTAALSQCSPGIKPGDLPTPTTTLPPGTTVSCNVTGFGGGQCQVTAPSPLHFAHVQLQGFYVGSMFIDDFSVEPPVEVAGTNGPPVNENFPAIAGHLYTMVSSQPATMSFG
jgi:hypothetical protein